MQNRIPTGYWAAWWSTYLVVASIVSTPQNFWALACIWSTYLLAASIASTAQPLWALDWIVVYLPPSSSYSLYNTQPLGTRLHVVYLPPRSSYSLYNIEPLGTRLHVVYLPPRSPYSFYSTEPLDTRLHNSIERQQLYGHNHGSCPEVDAHEWAEWKAEMGEIVVCPLLCIFLCELKFLSNHNMIPSLSGQETISLPNNDGTALWQPDIVNTENGNIQIKINE